MRAKARRVVSHTVTVMWILMRMPEMSTRAKVVSVVLVLSKLDT